MKKTLMNILFIACFAASAYGQISPIGIPGGGESEKLTTPIIQKSIFDVHELDELNAPSETDAYPWLSADGLRLYFCSDQGIGQTFYWSHRASIQDDFSAPIRLSSQLPIGVIAGC